jgi:hypothetical protein
MRLALGSNQTTWLGQLARGLGDCLMAMTHCHPSVGGTRNHRHALRGLVRCADGVAWFHGRFRG